MQYIKHFWGSTGRLSLMSLLAAGVALLMMQPASAALLMSEEIEDNDCAGYFGDKGFGSCQIFGTSDDGDIKISPVIIQFGEDGETVSDKNDDFSTIDGTEFDNTATETKLGGEWLSGSFTYTPDDADDPGVRYWSVKYGKFFKLFWVVDSDPDNFCGGGTTSPLTFDCLNLAEVVTSGTWDTNEQNAMSHVTFYDSDGPELVPAPGVLGLVGIGLIGLFASVRRRA